MEEFMRTNLCEENEFSHTILNPYTPKYKKLSKWRHRDIIKILKNIKNPLFFQINLLSIKKE